MARSPVRSGGAGGPEVLIEPVEHRAPPQAPVARLQHPVTLIGEVKKFRRDPQHLGRGEGLIALRQIHAVVELRVYDQERRLPVLHEVERSEEHTSELQSLAYLVCRLLLEKKKQTCLHRSAFGLPWPSRVGRKPPR